MSHHKTKFISDGPWILLLILASLIILATIAAIIAMNVLWNRYMRRRREIEQNMFQMDNVVRKPQEYEVQSLDMYVPQDDRDDLGELHVDFTPNEGISHVHHIRELPASHQQPKISTISRNRFTLNYVNYYQRRRHYNSNIYGCKVTNNTSK